MTEEEITTLARSVARKVAKRWGHCDYRDFISGAWHGIKKAVDRGQEGTILWRAGKFGIIDQLRESPDMGAGRMERGYCRTRGVVLTEFVQLVPNIMDTEDHREHCLPDQRLLGIWCENRWQRRYIGWRQRVVAYLHFVEGISQKEIGEYFGVTAANICEAIATFRDGVIYAVDSKRPGEDGSAGEMRSGEDTGERTGEPLRAAGAATEGSSVGDHFGDGGAGTDPGGVADDGGGGVEGGAGADGRREAELCTCAGDAGAGGAVETPQRENRVSDIRHVPTVTAVARRPDRRSVATVTASVDAPAAVASKAEILRERMLGAVSGNDMDDVMRVLLTKAKGGDLAAVAILAKIVGAL